MIKKTHEILDISGSTIDICVALPTWENKNIIWLQLESLCRQETQYNWELIICEEPSKGYFSPEGILPYLDRLTQVGCKRIVYIELTTRIPLSRKWVIIADHAKGTSFLLCASDNYSPSNRLQFTHDKLLNNFNWVDIGVGLFLHLFTFKRATYKNNPAQTGLFMGTKTSYIKKLKGPWPVKNIDGWIRLQQNIKPRYRHPTPLLGLHTDGANKISKKRSARYVIKSGKMGTLFTSATQTLDNILPAEIIEKLKTQFYNNKFKVPSPKPLSRKEEYKLKRYGKIR